MNGCTVLEDALAKGGKVVWDPPTRPRLLVPKGMGAAIQQELATVREVLRRATIFHEQAAAFIRGGGAIPFLALPEHGQGDGCFSCGALVERGRFRCAICALAVALALET